MQRTLAQNKIMHGLAGKLEKAGARPPGELGVAGETRGLGQVWLKRVCLEVSQQARSSALTEEQAREVIRRLTELSKGLPVQKTEAAPRKRRAASPRESARITPAQLAYIEKLLHVLVHVKGAYQRLGADKTRWRSWCEHYLRVPWPQHQIQADQAIEALKSLVTRELPSMTVLEQELKDVDLEPLNGWQLRMVKDGRARSGEWGPLQWGLFHVIYLQQKGAGHAAN